MIPKPILSVIIPTYKEALNIPVLIRQLKESLNGSYRNHEIIIVDDNSKDGTEEAVARMGSSSVKLIVRKNERGLSSAVIEGIKQSEGDVCVVMDADLSHPPEKVKVLADQILSNKMEFAIGSRFVEGGSMPYFNWFRKLNAWISRILARPFVKVKDPMAGFFAFRRSIISDIAVLNPLGFKIGLEIMVKCSVKKIIEIPIEFQKRLHGESKLSIKEQINYLRHLKRLFDFRYSTISQFIHFCAIGGLGMIIDLSVVRISYGFFGLFFRLSRILGFTLALISNFYLNRKITFRSSGKSNIISQGIKFTAVCLAGLAVNWSLSVFLHENVGFFYYHYLAASFIGIIGGTAINFIGSKKLVFIN